MIRFAEGAWRRLCPHMVRGSIHQIMPASWRGYTA